MTTTPGDWRPASHGGRHVALACRLALAAWLGSALLQLVLFLRPTPYGAPFATAWQGPLVNALLYDLVGTFLVVSPFLLVWVFRFHRDTGAPGWRGVHQLQIAVLTLYLLLSHIDHETIRFMGQHFTLSFAQTYEPWNASGKVMFGSFLLDRGGPGLPILIGLLVPGTYLLWSRRQLRRLLAPGPGPSLHFAVAVLTAVLPLTVTCTVRQFPAAQFKLQRVQPYIVTSWDEVVSAVSDMTEPPGFNDMVARYQADWLAATADPGWRFSDPAYPYLRTPDGPAPGGPEGWNVIYLQVETLRGWDSPLLRPDLTVSATPFLDGLARSGKAAYWTHHLSFGPPTVDNLIAAHCSITPHSRRHITTTFTDVSFYAFPEALRRRGYHTELFSAADPDWDNQTPWLRRWYDRLWFYKDVSERDREVFARASARIREIGAEGKPFAVTVVSATNHYPFRNPEPALDIAGDEAVGQRILNTLHYTDDVVREFVGRLSQEPWFGRTLIVIAGDHGYNLGEHGDTPGQTSLYRESVWVPLIIYGDHPRLPLGRHDDPASLLDLAPTLADLLGVREPNPWQGHSLVAGRRSAARVTFGKGDMLLVETSRLSAFTDGATGLPRLFDLEADPLQRRDLGATRRAEAASLLREAEALRTLNDYLIRTNRIWRR